MNARRDFLKNIFSLSLASSFLLLGQNVFSQEKKRRKGETQDPKTCDAKPGVDGAGGINYAADKSKVDAKAKAQADKNTIQFAQQLCSNCHFFDNGACTVITSGCAKVNPQGWCPTWKQNGSKGA